MVRGLFALCGSFIVSYTLGFSALPGSGVSLSWYATRSVLFVGAPVFFLFKERGLKS